MTVNKIKVHRSTVKIIGRKKREGEEMKRKLAKLSKLMKGKAEKLMIKHVK